MPVTLLLLVLAVGPWWPAAAARGEPAGDRRHAAALLAVTFFAFGTSTVSFTQLFGIGTGVAILLDATLVRGVLVPAIMRLAGGANWWAPAGLGRLHRRFVPADSGGARTHPGRPAAEPSS